MVSEQVASRENSKLTPSQKEALQRLQRDLEILERAFSLVVRIVNADQRWADRVERDEKQKETKPSYVSLKDKLRGGDEVLQKEALQEMYNYFPPAIEILHQLQALKKMRKP
jgi:hypothetical protein